MAYETEIAHLEQLLNSGVTATAADNERHEFDLEAARRRLAELKRLQAKTRKPRTSSIDLSGW